MNHQLRHAIERQSCHFDAVVVGLIVMVMMRLLVVKMIVGYGCCY
jgi:hypothetical protein